MSQHLKDFTHDMIARSKAPVAVSTIVAVFTNLGNVVPGETPEEQREAARDILGEDKRLKFDKETDHVEHAPSE